MVQVDSSSTSSLAPRKGHGRLDLQGSQSGSSQSPASRLGQRQGTPFTSLQQQRPPQGSTKSRNPFPQESARRRRIRSKVVDQKLREHWTSQWLPLTMLVLAACVVGLFIGLIIGYYVKRQLQSYYHAKNNMLLLLDDVLWNPQEKVPNLPPLSVFRINRTHQSHCITTTLSINHQDTNSTSLRDVKQEMAKRVWTRMVQEWNVQSWLELQQDCPCGATTWFQQLHPPPAPPTRTNGTVSSSVCVYASASPHPLDGATRDNISSSTSSSYIPHDFSRGPWWPHSHTMDVAWAVEFTASPRVPIAFDVNFIASFRQAAWVVLSPLRRMATTSHVGPKRSTSNDPAPLQEHEEEAWWNTKLLSYGFRYHANRTAQIRSWVLSENGSSSPTERWLTLMQVYENPLVSIPSA